jgi:hypothetical protein
MQMKHVVCAVALVLLCGLPIPAQRGRRGGGSGGGSTPLPIKGVIVSYSGALKQLTKKSILLQGEDGQLITIRRSNKTKFWNDNKEIKATDIDLETKVIVDSVEDNDLKFLAVAVRVDPGQKKPTLDPSPK